MHYKANFFLQIDTGICKICEPSVPKSTWGDHVADVHSFWSILTEYKRAQLLYFSFVASLKAIFIGLRGNSSEFPPNRPKVPEIWTDFPMKLGTSTKRPHK